ncbi:HAD hydrolase family protein [Prochlorococcus sp. AH-736-E15]|nr:HAD hydrolase family protein [Prochlorococcus sp. AH-736-E15]
MNLKKIFSLNKKKLKKISLLVLDVDGVLTDGGLFYDSNGEILKRFDVRDGLGIKLLLENNIEVAFLSGGSSSSTTSRAEHLGVKYCFCKVKNKKIVLEKLMNNLNLKKNQIAYVGDDLNDLILRNNISLFISPANADKAIKSKSNLTLQNKGGNGAVREIADLILNAHNKLEKYKKSGWSDKND